MATTNLGRVRGRSAYEVWLQAGNEGDEAAYLEAIKGATGVAGPNSISCDTDSSITGLLKGDAGGKVSAAVPEVDYPTVGQLAAQAGGISALEAAVGNIDPEGDDVATQLAALQATMGTVTGDAVGAQLAAHAGDITDLETAVGTIDPEGDDVATQLAAHASQLDAITNRNDTKSYGYNLTSGLRAYRAACADVDANPIKIALLGTSISYGAYASDLHNTNYPSRIRRQLQAKYGDVGYGNYPVPSNSTALATTPWWQFTGAWTYNGAYGIAGRCFYGNAVGSTATLVFVGNTLHLFFSKAANGALPAGTTVTIDGSAVTSPDFSGTASKANFITYSGLSDGEHTLVITMGDTSKYAYIEDALVDKPISSGQKGCYLYNFGHSSAVARRFTDSKAAYTIAPISASLVIVELGVNDTVDTAAFLTNMDALLAAINANPTTSVLLLSMYDWSTTEATLAAMATIRTHIYNLADTYNCAVLDVYGQWGTWAQADELGLWGAAGYAGASGHDTIHPSDKGHRLLAEMVLDKIL